MADERDGDAALSTVLRRRASYHKAPPDLALRVRASLPDVTVPAVRPIAAAWRPFALAASVAFVALLSWNVWTFTLPEERSVGLAPEILSAHLRSLMANHLTDVASSDQHTVKPWFNGRLDLSPPVTDLTGQGFPLVGGRLDYLDQRPVAALVYRHRLHIINLFVWPAAPDEQSSTTVALTRNGYNLLHWHDKGLAFWAVSDVAAADLGAFEKLIRDQSPKP
jgi:anti-sigma factor RsiW